ncbi:MAG: ribosomal protein S18-alanine N-acetyltransferase [Burkholderiales bacterium]|jgi:ribosomal-protein-alanine N-acetyltransferase|nr:ribosomal protein S18-alanine N-acetyltransferase [Burkholderiales bacterium]
MVREPTLALWLEQPYASPPSGFQMRMMQGEDLPQILAIEKEAHFTAWSEQAFLDAISVEDILPVVLSHEKIVAYGVLKILWQEADLLNLAVASEWRRHGLGRFLVRHLLHSAYKNGAFRVFLEVRQSNIVAQHLYRQEKFTVVGVRKDYYATADGGSEDALLMQWMCDDETQ